MSRTNPPAKREYIVNTFAPRLGLGSTPSAKHQQSNLGLSA